jgi:hypothetical protein
MHRISPTAALRILTAGGAYTPHEAATVLNEAICANNCRLWGDGTVLDPGKFQTGELALTASVEAADGRWRADIVSTRDNPSHPPVYKKRRPLQLPYDVCELDEHEVMALLPPSSGPTASVQWARNTTRNLQAAGKIPERATRVKAELARLLAAESQTAARAGQLEGALKASYIENRLRDWGIWPLSAFK